MWQTPEYPLLILACNRYFRSSGTSLSNKIHICSFCIQIPGKLYDLSGPLMFLNRGFWRQIRKLLTDTVNYGYLVHSCRTGNVNIRVSILVLGSTPLHTSSIASNRGLKKDMILNYLCSWSRVGRGAWSRHEPLKMTSGASWFAECPSSPAKQYPYISLSH